MEERRGGEERRGEKRRTDEARRSEDRRRGGEEERRSGGAEERRRRGVRVCDLLVEFEFGEGGLVAGAVGAEDHAAAPAVHARHCSAREQRGRGRGCVVGRSTRTGREGERVTQREREREREREGERKRASERDGERARTDKETWNTRAGSGS
eukprot:1346163-Rhodomonas_salina.1